MRRILLAVPLKGQLSSFFVKNLIETCRAIYPDIVLEFAFLEGAPVQQARNEIVDDARRRKFDELIFLDKDLDAGPEAVARILSHKYSLIVCALYCQRSLDTFWHVQAWSKTQKPHADGLLRVKQCAIGFCKINLSVFDLLEANNPDRLGMLTTTGGATKPLWEFFPMELIGPNTPRGRLNRILGLVEEIRATEGLLSSTSQLAEKVFSYATETDISCENIHMAEDYGFCAMLRASDIPIHVDTHLTIQHESSVQLPIPTDQVLRMLQESWRGGGLHGES